jgi:hypothetical protein
MLQSLRKTYCGLSANEWMTAVGLATYAGCIVFAALYGIMMSILPA